MSNLAIKPNENFIELLPGSFVDLQITSPIKIRMKTQLIGYSPGDYIMVKYPQTKRDFEDVLIEGNVLIVRYIIEGANGKCCTFSTSILNISSVPEKMILLSYPEHIAQRSLRMHQRYSTHLPAKILLDGEEKGTEVTHLRGVIDDISSNGCSFSFNTDNERLKVNERDIFIYIGYEQVLIKLPARVCNCRSDHGKVNVGVQFIGCEQQVRALLEQVFIVEEVE